MKNILICLFIMLLIPVLLKAQYTGGIGNGDASIGLTNVHLPVQKIETELPAKYILYQNYPNPFNSSTTIEFDLPEQKFVTLKIYDIKGQLTVDLINQQLSAGKYRIHWDAYNISTGIYIYKMKAGGYSFSKKLILLK